MSRASGETGDTMKARRKANGVAIVGTVETLIGTCKADQESFGIDGNGEMYCLDIGDGTVIDWDSADSKRFEGEPMFIDANGDHVKQSEIELIDDTHVLSGPCSDRSCTADATHVLYAPGSPKPVPGAWCREHAAAPAAEYLEKLQERWAVVECTRIEDHDRSRAREIEDNVRRHEGVIAAHAD